MGKGGSRSGAGRPGRKRKAEHYRKLDIRSMVRAQCIIPRNAFGWVWRNSEGEQTASVACEVNGGADAVTIRYQWRSPGETEWRLADTFLKLTSTACNYGGERWWFSYPCCQRRAAVLFITGGALPCATCARVSYSSQRGDVLDRLGLRQDRLKAKLIDGWHRPKGMRWKTFQRLRGKIMEYEIQWENALMAAMARMGMAR